MLCKTAISKTTYWAKAHIQVLRLNLVLILEGKKAAFQKINVEDHDDVDCDSINATIFFSLPFWKYALTYTSSTFYIHPALYGSQDVKI